MSEVRTYVRWRAAQIGAIGHALRVAFGSTRRWNCGNTARCGQRTVRLVNGAYSASWECMDLATKQILHCATKDLVPINRVRNALHSFRVGWRWWMSSWFHIDVGRRMGTGYAYYGTARALARRQRRFDRRYMRRAGDAQSESAIGTRP